MFKEGGRVKEGTDTGQGRSNRASLRQSLVKSSLEVWPGGWEGTGLSTQTKAAQSWCCCFSVVNFDTYIKIVRPFSTSVKCAWQ
jgi:hypothetical protein